MSTSSLRASSFHFRRQNFSVAVFVLNLQSLENLFSEPVFYVSVRFGPRRTVLCERKAKLCSFFFCSSWLLYGLLLAPRLYSCCVFAVPDLYSNDDTNRIGEELCSPRTLSLLNFYEHSNESQKKLFQVSTVNRMFFSVCFIGLVCVCVFFFLPCCWRCSSCKRKIPLCCRCRWPHLSELLYMKANLNMSRAISLVFRLDFIFYFFHLCVCKK